jgi:hypothetical protein
MKRIPQAAVKQLKDDCINLQDWERKAWWEETLRLLDQQGFTLHHQTVKMFENLAY